jgi:hypothetical protein
VLPLSLVVFIGFVGYSPMITVFTPLVSAAVSTTLPLPASA